MPTPEIEPEVSGTPELTAPETNAPEPTAAEPTEPEPTAPGSAAAETTAPEPTTAESPPAEPATPEPAAGSTGPNAAASEAAAVAPPAPIEPSSGADPDAAEYEDEVAASAEEASPGAPPSADPDAAEHVDEVVATETGAAVVDDWDPASAATGADAAPTAAAKPAAAGASVAEPAPLSTGEPAAEPAAPSEPSDVVESPAPQVAPPAPVARISVSRHVARALRAAGVRIAFTVPGESFLGLLEALPAEGIRVVTTRHENGAGFMAEAYGQLTGRAAVALVTRAVGAANLSIALHTARADSSPMVAIVGGVERRFRGREAFQEVDVAGTFGRLTKWAAEVADPAAVPGAVETALRELRTGRPGPVLLAIPEDVFDQTVPDVPPPPFRPRTMDIDPAHIRDVLNLLAGARRPAILAGAGVLRARATADLVALAEMLEVPVIASWRRPDVFPNDHRLYLGMAGFGAAPSVRDRLRTADAMLVIGCRLNEVTSFGYTVPGRRQRWAHVDVEPRHNLPGVPAARPSIPADSRVFLRAAIQRLRLGVLEAAPLDARREANAQDRVEYDQASIVDAAPWDGPGVHPGRVVATLQRLLAPDSIVTTDAGNFASWAARGYRWHRPATFLGPTSGAMGYGLPAAIAAALARPNRPVIALAGDGGFAMTMNELETAVRERARVVAIVFDNERFGTIWAHQEQRGNGEAGTDLGSIDFAAAARAFGANGVRVEQDEEFEPALAEALAATGPTVLHLRLDRRWVSIDRLLDAPPA